jgi:hypothetical protein
MLLFKSELVRLKKICVFSRTNGKSKSFNDFWKCLFVLVRKEIEENFSEKHLLNSWFIHFGFFINSLDLHSELFVFVIVFLIELIFQYFPKNLYLDRLLAMEFDGLNERKGPLKGNFLEPVSASEKSKYEFFCCLKRLVFRKAS